MSVDLGVCFRARANRPKTVSTAWILVVSAFAYLELLVCLAVWLSLNVAFVALRLYVTSDRRSPSEAFRLVRYPRLVN